MCPSTHCPFSPGLQYPVAADLIAGMVVHQLPTPMNAEQITPQEIKPRHFYLCSFVQWVIL